MSDVHGPEPSRRASQQTPIQGAGAESRYGFHVRCFVEDPECVGVRITDREYLLSRQDAVELALQLLEAGGVNLLSGLSPRR